MKWCCQVVSIDSLISVNQLCSSQCQVLLVQCVQQIQSIISRVMCSDGVWLYGLLNFISMLNSQLNMLFSFGCLKVKCRGNSRKQVIDSIWVLSRCRQWVFSLCLFCGNNSDRLQSRLIDQYGRMVQGYSGILCFQLKIRLLMLLCWLVNQLVRLQLVKKNGLRNSSQSIVCFSIFGLCGVISG